MQTDEERNRIIEENLGLILTIADRLSERYNVRDYWDDVLSICYLAIVEATSVYDPDRGSLVHFWFKCAKNRLINNLSSLSKSVKRGDVLEFNEEVYENPDVHDEWEDKIAQLNEVVASADLNEDEHLLVKMIGEGQPKIRMREALGLRHFRFNNFYNSTLDKIRARFEECQTN